MGYSELIKNFEKIREYMRQFYVYGFRTRNEFGLKSSRSYDNEHRRVESWLGEYMRFRHKEDGKVAFMSIDSRQQTSNPLYKAFKTKSFTDKDIIFHFYVLDLLCNKAEYTATEIVSLIDSKYLSQFENALCIDESTIRKKLKEYVKIGILKERKRSKEILYSINECDIDLCNWSQCISFFSEYNPLGVVGSYISDLIDNPVSHFRFKHRYIFQALDSQVLYQLTQAINEQRDIQPKVKIRGNDLIGDNFVHPLKIYISTQNGRQYLLCYHIKLCSMMFIRLDNIISLKIADKNDNRKKYLEEYENFKKHLWGVALSDNNSIDTVKMTIHIENNEEYIFNRLIREKRCGNVTRKDANTCVFTAQVYDALELVPWIRTFIGRIEDFYCSNENVTTRLNNDLETLRKLYGGDANAI